MSLSSPPLDASRAAAAVRTLRVAGQIDLDLSCQRTKLRSGLLGKGIFKQISNLSIVCKTCLPFSFFPSGLGMAYSTAVGYPNQGALHIFIQKSSGNQLSRDSTRHSSGSVVREEASRPATFNDRYRLATVHVVHPVD
jgi:hypothetical protein